MKKVSPSPVKTILLLNIKTIDQQKVTQLLSETHDVRQLTFPDYFEYEFSTIPHLIIISVLNYNCENISAARLYLQEKLKDNFNQSKSILPPFLALVSVEQQDKQALFYQGATDYISYPLIPAEFKYRVNQALENSETFKGSDISSYSVKDPLQESAVQFSEISEQSLTAVEHAQPSHLLAEKTADYLRSRLDDELTLSDLTNRMATNRNKLNKAFKNYFGMTVFDWVREQRLSLAATLLSTSQYNILQISEQVGYTDSNNFSTAFRREYQLSPRQYRNKMKSESTVTVCGRQRNM